MGGPHSNHLHALAAAGRRFGLRTVGLLRGHPQDTPTVQDLLDCGMALHWLGYGGYRERYQPEFWAPWQARYPGFHCVPEGGGGLLGALGCAELVAELRQPLEAFGWGDYHGCWLAAGTGTTLAGLVLGEAGRHPVYGALAGPGEHAVAATVATLLQQAGRDDTGYRLFDASRRGFGRFDPELVRFMRDAEREGGMPLEPVYTAKALMALREQVRAASLRLVRVWYSFIPEDCKGYEAQIWTPFCKRSLARVPLKPGERSGPRRVAGRASQAPTVTGPRRRQPPPPATGLIANASVR